MFREFFDAFSAYFNALRLTSKYGLWGYFLIPAAMSLLIGGVIFFTAYRIAGSVGQWLVNVYPWEWGQGFIETTGSILGGILVAALGVILFKNLVMVLASPFMSFLSEKIERLQEGSPSPKFSMQQAIRDIVRGVRIAIRLVVRELLFTLVLLLLGLIPGLNLVVPVLLFIVQSYYAGFGNMDFTLERHYRVRGSIDFVRRHRGLAIGNGMVYLFMYTTIIGFVFALPLGTIAATTETIKALKNEGSISSSH